MLRRLCGSTLQRCLPGRCLTTILEGESKLLPLFDDDHGSGKPPVALYQCRGIHLSLITPRGDDDDMDDRRTKMKHLIEELERSDARDEGFDGAKAQGFLDSFFVDGQDDGGSSIGVEYKVVDSLSDEGNGNVDLDEDEGEIQMKPNEDVVLRELRGLRRGSRRVVLQKLLQGGILQADPMAAEELKKIERSFRPPPGFRMKVVHINRTSKGTRSGGLFRFSALVVVGNGEGVLGWGYGKSIEVAQAVQKAQQSAYRNLYPIPRHNGHTIPEEITATFGKTKIIMYPKSSGRGIIANPMLASICQLAGIYDIGIKVHGSRNPQNTIKCLFAAFDSLQSEDDIIGYKDGILTIPVLTGRFGKLHL